MNIFGYFFNLDDSVGYKFNRFFFKVANRGLFLPFQLFIAKMFLIKMTGFEPGSSGVRINHYANSVTTIAARSIASFGLLP